MADIRVNFVPHVYQRDFLKKWRRFNVLVCHRRFGKTDLAVAKMIMAALTVKTKERHFAYICPLKGQAKDNSWHKFLYMLGTLRDKKVFVNGRKKNVVTIRNNDAEIEFYNGALIKLYGADRENAERIRGMALAGCIMDEVGDIDAYVWDEIVQPTLNSTNGWCLFIGTPKGPNLFRDLYEYSLAGDKVDSKEWHGAMYRLSDTAHGLYGTGIAEFGWCSQYGIEALRSRYSDRMQKYAREYECDFEAAVENAIIPSDVLKASMNKHMDEHQIRFGERVLSVDVARYGGDASVICKRQGLMCQPLMKYYGLDNMELADVVAREIRTFRPDAVFIDAGRGEGVIDRLRQLGYRVCEIHFGGKAANPAIYYNKRTEMYFEAYEWIKKGGCLPRDKALERELGVATYDDENGKFRMCKKKEMKAALNNSPDSSDAFVLSFAAPVRAQGDGFMTRAKTTSSNNYNFLGSAMKHRGRHSILRR